MNLFIYWFASPAWARIVETLLHSLWQGTVIAVGLGIALRRVARPEARYRLALLALAGMVAVSLVTWAVLQTAPLPFSSPAGVAAKDNTTLSARAGTVGAVKPDASTADGVLRPQRPYSGAPNPPPVRWSAWLAVVWLLGAAGMLVRAGSQVPERDGCGSPASRSPKGRCRKCWSNSRSRWALPGGSG